LDRQLVAEIEGGKDEAWQTIDDNAVLGRAIENLREVATKYSDTKQAAPILELLKQVPKNQQGDEK
jgi:hypothetical protein